MISMKTSKTFTKEDEILTKGIVEIYKEILKGDRRKFPNGTWKRPDALENSKKCVKYLIEEIYKFSDDEIKEKTTTKFFDENKLCGMLDCCFKGSPFDAINTAYPGRFKPWEFKMQVPRNYWNKNTAIEATKWLVEYKLKLTDENLKEKLSVKLFEENNLLGMLDICFNFSPFKAIEAAYPGKFKPWEFNRCPSFYWTKENGIKATKWLIEEKLKWSYNDIKEKLTNYIFITNGLSGMLQVCFSNSSFEAINATYPGKFKKEDFKGYQIHSRFHINKEETI